MTINSFVTFSGKPESQCYRKILNPVKNCQQMKVNACYFKKNIAHYHLVLGRGHVEYHTHA